MPKESYFITVKRLKENTFIHKSIHMMKVISPDRPIHLPSTTVQWLRSGNWRTISVEAALMCIQYADFELAYNWHEDLDKAEKILDALLLIPKKRKYAMQCEFLREESLANFIDTEYKALANKEDEDSRSRAPEAYSYSYRDREHEDMYRQLLSNPSIKTYMIESIWKHTPERTKKSLADHIGDHLALEKIPDWMFKEILDRVLASKEDDTSIYFRDARTARILTEAVKRKMLLRSVPAKETVASEVKPTTFEPRMPRSSLTPPVSPLPTVVSTSDIVSRLVSATTTFYVLPKKVV